MNTNDCRDVETMLGPYLDSELDAKTSLEISLHLKECPSCAARLAGEAAWQRKLQTALNAGEPTRELWGPIEERVMELNRQTSVATGTGDASVVSRPNARDTKLAAQVGRAVPGAPRAAGDGTPALPTTGSWKEITSRLAVFRGWRYWLWPSPRLYAGLAAAWALIIGIQIGTREPSLAGAPSPAETRTALAEQRHLLAELLGMGVPEAEPVGTPPPQTDARCPNRDQGIPCAMVARTTIRRRGADGHVRGAGWNSPPCEAAMMTAVEPRTWPSAPRDCQPTDAPVRNLPT